MLLLRQIVAMREVGGGGGPPRSDSARFVAVYARTDVHAMRRK